MDRSAVLNSQGDLTLTHGGVRAMRLGSTTSHIKAPDQNFPSTHRSTSSQLEDHGDNSTVPTFIPFALPSALTYYSFLDPNYAELVIAWAVVSQRLVSQRLVQNRQPARPSPKGRAILPASLRQDPLVTQHNSNKDNNVLRACIRGRASNTASSVTNSRFGVGFRQ